jgi:hypothetical protein
VFESQNSKFNVMKKKYSVLFLMVVLGICSLSAQISEGQVTVMRGLSKDGKARVAVGANVPAPQDSLHDSSLARAAMENLEMRQLIKSLVLKSDVHDLAKHLRRALASFATSMELDKKDLDWLRSSAGLDWIDRYLQYIVMSW